MNTQGISTESIAGAVLAVAADERASLKEKAIVFMLLFDPGMTTEELIKNSRDGRQSVYSGLSKLVELGLLEEVVERNGRGQYHSSWYRVTLDGWGTAP